MAAQYEYKVISGNNDNKLSQAINIEAHTGFRPILMSAEAAGGAGTIVYVILERKIGS